MSAPQFTPGPLHLRSSATPSANYSFHLYLADESGRKLAALWGGNEEKLANGNLWAAAPELYEACALLDAYLYATAPESNEAQIVRAALAKARGQ